MKKTFDLIRETVLITDSCFRVIDIFVVSGITLRSLPPQSAYYTYKSLVIGDGQCCLCGVDRSGIESPCVSNSTSHAIVGKESESLPQHHRATSYQLNLYELVYEEFHYFVDADNLFNLDDQPLSGTDKLSV